MFEDFVRIFSMGGGIVLMLIAIRFFHQVVDEVNQRLPEKERFHRNQFWTGLSSHRLFRLHEEWYPESRTRMRFGLLFAAAAICLLLAPLCLAICPS